MKTAQPIRARRLLTESGWLAHTAVYIEQGRITAIEPINAVDDSAQWDADILIPALIDTHVHGGAGADVMDGSHEALETLSQYLASQGVGAFLATTVTAPMSDIEVALRQVVRSQAQGVSGAELLGSYLEGPYFTPENKGAHPESLFRDPTPEELDHLITVSKGSLRVVALAPENPKALTAIRYLKSRGVNVMLGHTNADYDTTRAALDAGANGLVHCFNGMKGVHHREPGTVGAGLSHDTAAIELIADGHHVHPAVMNICCRCAPDRLVLISDAMRAAGMPDGQYQLGEMQVTMKDGVVRTAVGGLAGSTLSLSRAIKTMVNDVGQPLEKAVEMASLIPARLLGIDDRLGSIATGKSASFVALNHDYQVMATWVNGRQVWSASAS
ncbi:N-acetylglucosamine-6-phosphate deacetylase [Photobacterium galatheae]|uniref:N-acetylglucosamine-6-phosphate deacetylase n=1 Tax=Photobacterium galatheae TaxID=1654360 RepID=A0A066RWE2_9GAMM|nr:N-acetylglucosamine-6-phosphate deacetylase [Photobacterium galatheae]KDM91678.1 N-acetylglucosamine-6-phosphate deacetylase [Photobacterium galatheae]MCM0151579.1 N-acetylglucosamine-6-phosphate deacetylase [Photobacterium galatheae]